MNRSAFGWIAVVAAASLGVSACSGLPDMIGFGSSRKVALNPKGVRDISVPPNLEAGQIALIKDQTLLAKAMLSTSEVINQMALPEYLRNAKDEGQGHLSSNGQLVESKKAENEGGNEAVRKAIDTELLNKFDYLWAGDKASKSAEDVGDVVDVEVKAMESLPESVTDEPVLALQKAYVKGRQAWRSRNAGDAKKYLEEALSLAPDEPEVLRMLGWVYTMTGNKVKGTMLLKRVLEQKPDDIETLHMVGRAELDEGNVENSIALLGVVYNKLNAIDEGRTPKQEALYALTQYYLAAAFRQGGYVQAAADQFGVFLAEPRYGSMREVFGRELLFVGRQVGLVWLTVGDLKNRIDDPMGAMAAYAQAEKNGVTRNDVIASRYIYSQLRMDNEKAAMKYLIELLHKKNDVQKAVEIAEWMVEQGVSRDGMKNDLIRVYEQKGEGDTLAILIGDVVGGEEGKAFLVEHLAKHPENELVFKALLSDWVLTDKARGDVDAVREAVRITRIAMDGMPQRGGAYARDMMREIADFKLVLQAIDQMDAAEKGKAVVRVLYGLAAAMQQDLDTAEKAFEEAHQKEPELLVATLELAKMKIVKRQYDQALKMLEPIAEQGGADVALIQLRALSGKGENEKALELVERVLKAGNDDPTLVIEKSKIYFALNDLNKCEQTLLDAINMNPEEEMFYSALMHLYDGSRGREFKDVGRRYQRLTARLWRKLPKSKLARMKRAEWLTVQGNVNDAEVLMLDLLRENERDWNVLTELLRMYIQGKMFETGHELIDAQLAKWPADRELLRIGMQYCNQIGDQDSVLKYTEKLILLEPKSPDRQLRLAGVYVASKRDMQASVVLAEMLKDPELHNPHIVAGMLWSALYRLELIESGDEEVQSAMERFPDAASKIGYQWAILIDSSGDKKHGEQVMLDVYEKDPSYVAAANHVAYNWVVQGKNYERAEEMIRKAVEAEPKNAAFLDSLGWVLYCKGQFEDAAEWLKKSLDEGGDNSPVVFSHYGDALIKTDKVAEAVEAWIKARDMIYAEPQRYTADIDPELDGLLERLEKQIEEQNGRIKNVDIVTSGEKAE